MPEISSYIWIALSALIIALDLWAIVSVFRSDTSVSSKSLWALGIAVFPLVGLAAWGIAGPRGFATAPSSAEHSK